MSTSKDCGAIGLGIGMPLYPLFLCWNWLKYQGGYVLLVMFCSVWVNICLSLSLFHTLILSLTHSFSFFLSLSTILSLCPSLCLSLFLLSFLHISDGFQVRFGVTHDSSYVTFLEEPHTRFAGKRSH